MYDMLNDTGFTMLVMFTLLILFALIMILSDIHHNNQIKADIVTNQDIYRDDVYNAGIKAVELCRQASKTVDILDKGNLINRACEAANTALRTLNNLNRAGVDIKEFEEFRKLIIKNYHKY